MNEPKGARLANPGEEVTALPVGASSVEPPRGASETLSAPQGAVSVTPPKGALDDVQLRERERTNTIEALMAWETPQRETQELSTAPMTAGPSTPLEAPSNNPLMPPKGAISATADFKTLQESEEPMRPLGYKEPKKATWGEVFSAMPEMAEAGVYESSGGMIEAAAGMQKFLPGRYVVAATNALASVLAGAGDKGWEDSLNRFGASDQKAIGYGQSLTGKGEGIAQAALPEGELSLPKRAALSAGASILTQAPVMAAGLVTRNPNIVANSFGLFEFGQAYGESFEQDGDEVKALRHAFVSGLAEKYFEGISAKWLFKNDAGFKERVLGFAYRELGGENATEAVQKVSRYMADLPEDMSAKAWANMVAETSLATLMSAGVQSGTFIAAEKGITAIADNIYQQRQKKIIKEFSGKPELKFFEQLLGANLTYEETKKLLEDAANRPSVDIGPGNFGANWFEAFDPEKNSMIGIYSPRQSAFLPLSVGQGIASTEKFLNKNLDMDTGVPLLQAPTVPGQVRVAMPAKDELTRLIQNYKETLQAVETHLLALDPATTQYQTQLQTVQQYRQALKNKLAQKTRRDDIVNNARQVLQGFVNTYAPGMKLILETRDLGGTVRGQATVLADGTHLITLNPKSFLAKPGKGPKVQDEFSMLDTLAHEFGHNLVFHYFNQLPQTYKDALFNDYKEWLLEGKGKRTFDEFVKWQDAPGTARDERGRLGPDRAKKSNAYKRIIDTKIRSQPSETDNLLTQQEYMLSFDEYMANQVAKAISKSPRAQDIVGTHYKRVAEVLKRFWQRFQKDYGAKQTVEAWLENLAAEIEINGAKRQLRAMGIEATEKGDIALDSKSLLENLAKKINMPKEVKKLYEDSIDNYNRVMKYGYTLLQLAEANATNLPLQNYVETVRAWANLKSIWANKANDVLNSWNALGKEQADRLGKFLLATAKESDLKGRKLTPQELLKMNEYKAHRLDDDAMATFDAIQEMFDEALGFDRKSPSGLYAVLLRDINRDYKDNPQGLIQAVKELDAEMTAISNRTYFPFSRFGRFTVIVKAHETTQFEGKVFKPGDVISFQAYDTESEQKAAYREAQRKWPQHGVAARKMDDGAFSFQGLPPQLIHRMKEKLDLTQDQKELLDGIIFAANPSNSYLKHMKQRKATPGYSEDAMRVFADYFQHFSGHLARATYYYDLNNAITEEKVRAGEIARKGGDATNTDEIASHMKKHYDYIMSAENEWANLRALGFLAHLGYNIKSAWVNLYQVPMMTYSYLAARKEIGGGLGLGDARAAAALLASSKDVPLFLTGKKQLTQEEVKMLDILKETGIINESLASDLAAMAEGGILSRYLPGQIGKSKTSALVLRRVAHGGAVPFQLIEQFNRRVTALAAYRMATKAGISHDEAVIEARRAIEKTQYEYARWNRPRMMRGKKSVLFLFMQHLQNTLHFMATDPGGARAIIMLVAMAGLSGLPFAEDIMDLLDLLLDWYNKRFGQKLDKADVRRDLREYAVELGLNPDLVMHGLASRYGLGPIHALELAGVPVPNVDVSGSLTLGRVIPGSQALLNPGQRPDETIGKATQDTLGAAFSPAFSVFKMLNSESPLDWKELESGIPMTALRNVSKAIRLATEGQETDWSGAEIASYDLGSWEDRLKLLSIGLSFRSTEERMIQEKRFAQKETEEYWLTRRALILQAMNIARDKNDREGLADANAARKRFNNSVPASQLKITGRGIVDSYIMYRKGKTQVENDLPRNRRSRQIYREMEDAYPTMESEDE